MLKITLIVIIIIKYKTNIFRNSIVVYIKFNISLRSWLDLSIKYIYIYIYIIKRKKVKVEKKYQGKVQGHVVGLKLKWSCWLTNQKERKSKCTCFLCCPVKNKKKNESRSKCRRRRRRRRSSSSNSRSHWSELRKNIREVNAGRDGFLFYILVIKHKRWG